MHEVIEAQIETVKPFGTADQTNTRTGENRAVALSAGEGAKADVESAAGPADGLTPAAVKAIFRDYLTTLKRDKSTINSYAACLNRFFAFMAKKGVADLRAVTRADIHD